MDIFRRIGTQKKKFKVQFFIGRLKFSQYRAGKVYIVIKRGDHKVKSQQKLQMSNDNKLNFNKQILQIQATLYFDEKQNKYQQKLGELNVVLLDQKQNKILLGSVPFDLANYANSGQQSVQEKRKLQQTPKKLSGLIQFNVFVKYIGQGSQSSLDKASDFFFGKTKDQNPNQNIKQKNPESSSVKKRQDKSLLKSQKVKSKTKDKQKIESQYLKYKVSKSKQKPPINPKSLKNRKELSEESQNQQESQNEKKVFYFDEPSAVRIPQESNKSQVQKKSIIKGNLISNGGNRQKQNLKKNPFHYDAQNGSNPSQEENIETSEVEPVQVFGNFGQSNVESINSEPIKPTKSKINVSEKNFIKNRSKVQMRINRNEQEDDQQISVKQRNKESKSIKNEDKRSRKQERKIQKQKQKFNSQESNPFVEFNEERAQTKMYRQERDYDENSLENSPGVSPFRSPIYIKQTSSILTKQNNTRKKGKDVSIQKVQQSKKSNQEQKYDSDLPDKYYKLQKQNQNLKKQLKKSQQIIKQFENQKSKYNQEISELSEQIEYYQCQLKQKQDEISHFHQQNVNFQQQNMNQDKNTLQKYIQDIKRIQRQKNELIVENSKLKEKYKRDFAKFQQILSQKQSNEQQQLGNMKIEIQKLKQQNSSFRQRIQKLTKQKDQKTSQLNKIKNINKDLSSQFNQIKDSLSQIKLKICTMLNQALSTGQQSAIQLLMELNQQ